MSPIIIHQPTGKDGVPAHPSLSKAEFPIEVFQGKWYVIQSTLGMWKSRKDVTITYTPHTPPPNLALNDHVQYRSLSSPSSKSLSSVVGISSLIPTAGAQSVSPAVDDPAASAAHEHGAHFKWRGSGLLIIASSKWQVLGYDLSPGQGWAVTYFEKTLFTPAGLDIYARAVPGMDGQEGLGEEAVAEIVRRVQALEGEVGELAKSFFAVKHGD